MRAWFLTYNSIGRPGTYQNGLLELNGHQATIVQHPKGKVWGVNRNPEGSDQPPILVRTGSDEERAALRQIAANRAELTRELYGTALVAETVPDFLVVYVGSGGSEGAIELASCLPGEKVRFVLCDCNLRRKMGLIKDNGMEDSQYFLCECGGQLSMERILRVFLETGSIGL